MTIHGEELLLDTVVHCRTCGRTQDVCFAGCLRSGWPKCHGQTMRLVSTTAVISAAVAQAVGLELPPAARDEDLFR